MHRGANVADARSDLRIGDRGPMAHADRHREARRVGVTRSLSRDRASYLRALRLSRSRFWVR